MRASSENQSTRNRTISEPLEHNKTTDPVMRQKITHKPVFYKGITYDSQSAKYSAKVSYMELGSYHLQCDAALAYDQGADELSIGGERNFDSADAYRRARERELKVRNIGVETIGSSREIGKQIEERIFMYLQSRKKPNFETVRSKEQGVKRLAKAANNPKGANIEERNASTRKKSSNAVATEQPIEHATPCRDDVLVSSGAVVHDKEADFRKDQSRRELSKTLKDVNQGIKRVSNQQYRAKIDGVGPFVTEVIAGKTCNRERSKLYSRPLAFRGTFSMLGSSMYGGKICFGQKEYFLGSYQLEADAALASDAASRLLKVPRWVPNFPTAADHLSARTYEMIKRRISMEMSEHLDAVDMRIEHYLNRIKSELISAISSAGGKAGTLLLVQSTSNFDHSQFHLFHHQIISPKLKRSFFTPNQQMMLWTNMMGSSISLIINQTKTIARRFLMTKVSSNGPQDHYQ